MHCAEQLEKNLISVSSTDHLKRGRAGVFWLQPVLLDFFSFFEIWNFLFTEFVSWPPDSLLWCQFLTISKVTCLIFISFLVFWKFSVIRGEKPSVGNAFKQGPVIQSATHGTGNTWRLSVSIKSGDNSRTTYMISIVAFNMLETQIVLNICD